MHSRFYDLNTKRKLAHLRIFYRKLFMVLLLLHNLDHPVDTAILQQYYCNIVTQYSPDREYYSDIAVGKE